MGEDAKMIERPKVLSRRSLIIGSVTGAVLAGVGIALSQGKGAQGAETDPKQKIPSPGRRAVALQGQVANKHVLPLGIQRADITGAGVQPAPTDTPRPEATATPTREDTATPTLSPYPAPPTETPTPRLPTPTSEVTQGPKGVKELFESPVVAGEEFSTVVDGVTYTYRHRSSTQATDIIRTDPAKRDRILALIAKQGKTSGMRSFTYFTVKGRTEYSGLSFDTALGYNGGILGWIAATTYNNQPALVFAPKEGFGYNDQGALDKLSNHLGTLFVRDELGCMTSSCDSEYFNWQDLRVNTFILSPK